MNNHEFKLTAVVLVYNGEPYLEECLKSLVNQTIEGLEILLVNDASTDDSLSICRKFERDYSNVRIINKESNKGLADSANIGIEQAKGEYVILVDNDDIIPPEAYEKLYDAAKDADADISIGKANYLYGRRQQEMVYLETDVWKRHMIIDDVNDFPELFNDAFYWNKIIRKDLLMEHDIRLPFGMIYADRYFSHMAYVKAERIAIIPDCVYLWRRRSNSLTKKLSELPNYTNRIESYELDLDNLIKYSPNYFKALLRRILLPIDGILDDKDFEEYLFDRVYRLLKEHEDRLEDIYDNNLTNIYNIFLYLILNNKRDELRELLELDWNGERDILDENGKSYWNIAPFRNPKYGIPDEFFEIKYIQKQFINIAEITIDDEFIVFDDIKLPTHYNIANAEVLFKGKTNEYGVLKDNIFRFAFERIDDGNLFRAVVPLDELNIFEKYEIYFEFESENVANHDAVVLKDSIGKITNNGDVKISNISKNLIFLVERLEGEFKIDHTDDKIIVRPKDISKIKKGLKIFFRKMGTEEEVYFDFNPDEGIYELNWEFFLDKDAKYNFFIESFNYNEKVNRSHKMHLKYLNEFEKTSFKHENCNISIVKTSYGNIILKSE